MKTNPTYIAASALVFIVAISSCHSNTHSDKKDTAAKSTSTTAITEIAPKQNVVEDSVLLTDLVKKTYQWHLTTKMKYDGFKPIQLNAKDTLYKAIDLDENQKAIDELKATGLFADDFLKDYRNVAIRMDKELKNGSSIWPANGDLSTFGDEVDEWCSCQDSPIDNYWKIIKLKNIKINNDKANFEWFWDDKGAYNKDFVYKAGAIKQNGNWKISYLQGYDMKAYSWEWAKKNKWR